MFYLAGILVCTENSPWCPSSLHAAAILTETICQRIGVKEVTCFSLVTNNNISKTLRRQTFAAFCFVIVSFDDTQYKDEVYFAVFQCTRIGLGLQVPNERSQQRCLLSARVWQRHKGSRVSRIFCAFLLKVFPKVRRGKWSSLSKIKLFDLDKFC